MKKQSFFWQILGIISGGGIFWGSLFFLVQSFYFFFYEEKFDINKLMVSIGFMVFSIGIAFFQFIIEDERKLK